MPGRPPPAPSSNTSLLLINSLWESRYEAKAIAAFHLNNQVYTSDGPWGLNLTNDVPREDENRRV